MRAIGDNSKRRVEPRTPGKGVGVVADCTVAAFFLPKPYADEVGPDGLLRYKYRGEDAGHRDNVGLREAMKRQLPLVYLHGIVEGRYMASWPVFIVGDDPVNLTFTVAVDEQKLALTAPSAAEKTGGGHPPSIRHPAGSPTSPPTSVPGASVGSLPRALFNLPPPPS